MSPLRFSALLLALTSLSATADTPASLPRMKAIIFTSTEAEPSALLTLARESLAAGDDGYIIPAASGSKEGLLQQLASLNPTVLAHADYQASTIAGTAVDLVQGSEMVTLRIKALQIDGERFSAWYGIKRSSTGQGAPKPISQKPLRVDLAYGEALVAPITPGLFAAFIPGPFDPVMTDNTPEQSAQIAEATILIEHGRPADSEAPAASETRARIIWDAVDGALLPDAEALERIRGH